MMMTGKDYVFQVLCRGTTVAEYVLLPVCRIANTQPGTRRVTSGFKRIRLVIVAVIATDRSYDRAK